MRRVSTTDSVYHVVFLLWKILSHVFEVWQIKKKWDLCFCHLYKDIAENLKLWKPDAGLMDRYFLLEVTHVCRAACLHFFIRSPFSYWEVGSLHFSPKIENGSPTCLGLWNESLTPNSPDNTCQRHLASLNFNNLFYKFSFLSPTQNISVCLKLSSPTLEFLSSSLRLSEFCPPNLPGPLINTP